MKATLKIDHQALDAAFRDYISVSKRGISEDVNQTSYSICISAVALTKRATKSSIRSYLNRASRINPTAPIAAILVNWRRGLKGQKGLFGENMKAEVDEFIRKQADSINFLRAGWLSAVAVLARSIRKSPGKNAIRFLSRFGTHGGATASKPGNNPTAYFWNQAFARHTSTQNGVKFAEEGLQKSVTQEIGRMRARVARKMEERARATLGKFFRV